MNTEEVARLTLYTTIAAAGINFLLTVLTAIYVYFTRRMVCEMQAARQPSVFIDLEFPDEQARIAIGNSGESPAVNVVFEIKEDIPWRHFLAGKDGLKSLEVIKHGVSFLPPDRVLKFMGGYVDWEKFRQAPGQLQIKIKFDNEAGHHFTRDYRINISQYAQLLYDTFRDPSTAIAQAIRESERSRRSKDSMQSIFQSPKRTCPICAQRIPKAAKKCPECLEFIDPEPEVA